MASRITRAMSSGAEDGDAAVCTVTKVAGSGVGATASAGATKPQEQQPNTGGGPSRKKGSRSASPQVSPSQRALDMTMAMLKATTLTCVCAVVFMAVVPRHSELLPPFARSTEHDEAVGEVLEHPQYTRTVVSFTSGDANGTMLVGWRYLPTDWQDTGTVPRPPVIIMAHGLGGQRDFGLHKTADVFARVGFGVLVFDYRTFGASDGEPRHWASPSRHLDDWRAAILYANSTELRDEWDASRLVLWGTSYSGGHVLVLSAELGDKVAGVISQVPHLNAAVATGASLVTRGLFPSVRLFVAGVYDWLRARLGLSPVYVRLVGLEGTLAVMGLTEEGLQAYLAKQPRDKLGGWQNQVLARFVLEGMKYSPNDHLANITQPVLLAAAKQDTTCPAEAVHQAGKVLGIDILVYNVDHFNIYLGDTWVHLVAHQLDFACNITRMVCPRDPTVEMLTLSTTIGGRHRGSGADMGGDPAAAGSALQADEAAEDEEAEEAQATEYDTDMA